MLNTDQSRALAYLKSPCHRHGIEVVRINEGGLEGKYCLECINEVARLITDARDEGRRHPEPRT